MKKLLLSALCALLLLGCLALAVSAESGTEFTVLFTHDIHDYLYPTAAKEGEPLREHGGAARLVTLLRENSDENTLYLDAGDFSMGTLFQAAYATDAVELRTLGLAGCAVATFGNHEFDYGSAGAAQMLRAALESGDPLPKLVSSNLDFSGSLTEDQRALKEAFEDFGVEESVVLSVGGEKIGVFGLVGYDCIECIQTELSYIDHIEAARAVVAKLESEGCGVIVALSHAGTDGNRETGEDIELAKAVPGIDLIVSGHTHTSYDAPVTVGRTVLVSCGEYLNYVGRLRFTVENGSLSVTDYRLLPVDGSVAEDAETAELLAGFMDKINEGYLADEGVRFDDVICHSDFDLMSGAEMSSTHQEYNIGNLIADSYLYEARRNGIDDIDAAIVGYGTIRSTIRKGDITPADVFEICSLGVGADGSAGHPLLAAWVTGKELKLITELDASLGPAVSYIKMSYSGLSVTFNDKRILLDRVTDVHLTRPDGSSEEIEDGKLYKICVNMYAANMLGMLNGLTKGILSISPKYEGGSPIADFYDVSLKTADGREIKEWTALKNYLMSFEKNEDGVPELPARYEFPEGRKNHVSEGGLAVLRHPGTACTLVPTVIASAVLLIALAVLLIVLGVKRKRRKKAAKAAEAKEAAAAGGSR